MATIGVGSRLDIQGILNQVHELLCANEKMNAPPLCVPRHLYDRDPEAAYVHARMYGFNGVHIDDPLPIAVEEGPSSGMEPHEDQ